MCRDSDTDKHEEVTIDFTHPEEQDWMSGEAKSPDDYWQEIRGSKEEQWQRLIDRYVDEVADVADCSQEEAEQAVEEVGDEQIREWRSKALEIAKEEEIYGLARFQEVRYAVATMVIDSSEHLDQQN